MSHEIHPYFIAKARNVFRKAGGDPANAMPLAAWAQEVKQQIDSHPDASKEIGVLVAEDGTIHAKIELRGTKIKAWYVTETEHDVAKNYNITGGIPTAARGIALIGKEIGQRLIQVSFWDVALGPSPEQGVKLSLAEAAEKAGVGASTFQSYVSRGHAPQPDGTEGRANFWWAWTVEDWLKTRPGRGARTDLVAGE